MGTELKDRINFIGVGQCGGNIAAVAASKGFTTGVINTSDEDLNAPNLNNVTYKFKLGDLGGCGKERKLGQELVKNNYTKIVEFIKENFLNDLDILTKKGQKKIIFLCFSTGGGTGSGVSPILLSVLSNMFKKKSVVFAAIAATPSDDESIVSLYNSRKCLEELNSLNIPILIPDNNNYMKNVSKKTFYEVINLDIVLSIKNFIETRPSSIINMDTKDKTKLLCTPGITIITSEILLEEDLKDSITLAKAIERDINRNVFTKINFDKKVKKVGFIFDIHEEISKLIDYDEILKNIGKPMELFEGIYPISNNEKPMFTVILTGLTFPSKKIKDIDDILKESNIDKEDDNEENIFNKMNNSNMGLFDSLFNEDNDTSDDEEDIDISSILSNF